MQDTEIEWLKERVSCAALLERLPPPWRLDRAESSRNSLKYRRQPGEIVIVTHEGRGWWDPLSDRKGDVFTLVQHLDPALNFGAARKVLRSFAGAPPVLPDAASAPRTRAVPVALQWKRRRPLSRGSLVWRYLTGPRGLPERILVLADAADAVREGPQGSAWFAHRDAAGALTGIEMRGPAWRGFSAGGTKTLFRLPGGPGSLPRVAVCEAAIDALSLAAIEQRGATRSMPRPPAAWGRGRSLPCKGFAGARGRPRRPLHRRDRRRCGRQPLRGPARGYGRASPGSLRAAAAAGPVEGLERHGGATRRGRNERPRRDKNESEDKREKMKAG